MQALMTRSEENHGVDCLGVFPGEVKFFGNPLVDNNGQKLKVPHMGWNQLHQTKAHPLWEGIQQDSRFYFVHSYYVHAEDPSLIAATAGYGVDIHAALHRDNIFAVQCHPEKSSDMGLKLLSNFLKWDGQG
jgi:glutamine amidotransferase